VVYGSQNMGGVINIILKTGRTAPGNLVEAMPARGAVPGQGAERRHQRRSTGTSARGRHAARLQSAAAASPSRTPTGRATAAPAPSAADRRDQRVDVTVRSDGIYDAGFRGSASNVFAFDNRYNQSVDVTYNGQTPDGRGNVYFQAYYVQDVDDLNNPSPLSTLNATAARTTMDHNRRQLDIVGARFQPRYRLWSTNELLVGMDWEESWIRSTRYRAGGTAVTQLSPQDNNETSNVFAIYAEDSQKLFDDRMVLRGGVRQTFGSTALDFTSNATTLIPNTTKYQAPPIPWARPSPSPTGSTRVGASSGFARRPRPSSAPTSRRRRSARRSSAIPNLLPETAHSSRPARPRTGRRPLRPGAFQNIISNRIQR
jgi:vitamin B12 transporter